MRQFSVTEEQNASSQNNHNEQSQTSQQQWCRHRHFFLSDIVEEENLKQWAEGRLKTSIARSSSVACHLTRSAFWEILLLDLLYDGKIEIWVFLYILVWSLKLHLEDELIESEITQCLPSQLEKLPKIFRFWVILQEKCQIKKPNYLNVVAN